MQVVARHSGGVMLIVNNRPQVHPTTCEIEKSCTTEYTADRIVHGHVSLLRQNLSRVELNEHGSICFEFLHID